MGHLMSLLSSFNIYVVSLALTEDEMLLAVFEKEMVKTLLRENERLQRESAEEMSTQILSRCVLLVYYW